jgi:hypothetical protein
MARAASIRGQTSPGPSMGRWHVVRGLLGSPVLDLPAVSSSLSAAPTPSARLRLPGAPPQPATHMHDICMNVIEAKNRKMVILAPCVTATLMPEEDTSYLYNVDIAE